MSDNRTRSRRRMFKAGKIALSDKAPKVECVIRNVSDRGACLEVSTPLGIQSRFNFICDGVCHPCRIAWIRDNKIGVVFTEAASEGKATAQKGTSALLMDGGPCLNHVSAGELACV